MKDGKIWINIDLICALLCIITGICALFFVYYLSNAMLLLVALTLVSAPLIYLLCRNRFQKIKTFDPKEICSRKGYYTLSILFYMLFSINLIIFFVEDYSRPIIFLFIASLMAGIIAVSIYGSSTNLQYSLILVEIISLSSLLQTTAYFQFPSMIGNDPNAHANYILSLSMIGDVSKAMAPYQSFPLMHILATSIHTMTELPIKYSMAVITFCMIFSLIFLFLIGKKIFGEKISLIGVLFLIVSSPNILLGYIIIPQSFGITFIPILIFLLFNQNNCPEKYKYKYYIFTIVFLIALLFTHSITTFVTLLILISILIAQALTNLINQEKINFKNGFLHLFITIIFFILIIEYWSYALGFSRFALNSIRVGFSSPDLAPASSVLYEMQGSIIYSFMKYAPTILTIFFAIIGSLYILKWEKKHLFVLFGWGIVTFIFFCVFLDLHSFLPGRWLAFIPLILFFPLALSFNFISSLFSRKLILMFIIVTIITFTMITNYEANVTNLNPFTPYPTQALTKSEIISANTFSKIVSSNDNIYTDLYFRNVESGIRKFSDGSSIYLNNKNFSGILVIREEILRNVFFAKLDDTSSHYSSVQVNPKLIDIIMSKCKIYYSGKIEAIINK